jgi:hypothetical protein
LYTSSVATRRIGISEARRLLPDLVKTIGKDGGRVDITYRGEPRVSLLRVSDVKGSRKASRSGARSLPAELQVELSMPAGDLVEAIRELRGRQGRPRADWLTTATSPPRKRVTKRSARR